MPYTTVFQERHAKAYGKNLRISTKHTILLCNVIRKKPFKRAKRLLEDLIAERRTLGKKYYTKTAGGVLQLLNSCEKNAEALGLDAEHLIVHASAHKGENLRRRRRKQGFGSKMKSTNLEIILKEKIPHDFVHKDLIKRQMTKDKSEDQKPIENINEIKKQSESMKEKSIELEKQVEEILEKDIPTHADKRKSKGKKG